ncbi:hypothetical protein AGABI1DRAFT_32382 [Agaricus bisporus var. burnettii JB137-S8]|uniref:Uncharacterized protein n=1 Tax=Agaricus bisporus var. burnettii (strain JB137-S8 / ATCC MYA-4627 / FGSC 10392) TaxID=597362 RepID=K5X730_AGABU|nr:uncharacterized protein AGABI1DRAFT_32382 [Agaricus bisporus var. burnettii JB137-S8]EKM83681.1 hypothetical protein AGABI1DRAFT_32382 [Agaricus bisporus var. burnettii JB137-S8]
MPISKLKAPLFAPNVGIESPGSSVFDLPIQPILPPHVTARPHPRAQDRVSGQPGTPLAQTNEASFLVISGGTGGNAICSAFGNACYVLPVSDDGGSSSEIIRVLGGPSVGDIRSRLVRLIPSDPPSPPLEAIQRLLSYRLPAEYGSKGAREEWRDIVEGRSVLWSGIPDDRKETIRGFLVYFESELLRRAHKNFDFRNGSIGNYFIAAAQNFFRSLPSAIFLFSSITNSQATILPVIVTNHTVTIAAELLNGTRLVGQCEISHPVPQDTAAFTSNDPLSPIEGLGESIAPKSNVMFGKDSESKYEHLSAPITRLYYINAYGMEIHPSPNAAYLANLGERDVLIYSCGSLWTSIIPCLALRGVADGIARSPRLQAKILLLNSENDRETEGYTAVDYILAIGKTLNSNYQAAPYGLGNASTTYPISAFVTHLVYLSAGSVRVDVNHITSLGVRCMKVERERGGSEDIPRFRAREVESAVDDILRELKAA